MNSVDAERMAAFIWKGLSDLSEDDRQLVMYKLGKKMCLSCSRALKPDEVCHCMNDE